MSVIDPRKLTTTGFTLAELLIALAILGVIATFTIPKILQAQQDTRSKSIAKEVAGMISEAKKVHEYQGLLNANTYAKDLFQYMNYVKYDTSSTIDVHPGFNAPTGTIACSATNACIHLHNGSILLGQNSAFGGTGTTNFVYFILDPDGAPENTDADVPGKSVQFLLYYNGRIRTRGTAFPNSCTGGACATQPDSAYEPSWFSWD